MDPNERAQPIEPSVLRWAGMLRGLFQALEHQPGLPAEDRVRLVHDTVLRGTECLAALLDGDVVAIVAEHEPDPSPGDDEQDPSLAEAEWSRVNKALGLTLILTCEAIGQAPPVGQVLGPISHIVPWLCGARTDRSVVPSDQRIFQSVLRGMLHLVRSDTPGLARDTAFDLVLNGYARVAAALCNDGLVSAAAGASEATAQSALLAVWVDRCRALHVTSPASVRITGDVLLQQLLLDDDGFRVAAAITAAENRREDEVRPGWEEDDDTEGDVS